MENIKKLTLDILKQYIRDNIQLFTNEEIIIEIKQIKKNKNIVAENEDKEYNIIDKLKIDKYNKSILYNSKHFSNLFSSDLLNNFLIFKCINLQDTIDIENISLETMSFYYSILSALEPTFLESNKTNKIGLLSNLLNYLKKDIMIDGFKEHKYSQMKWKKNDIFKNLEKINDKIIRYVSDVFHINIFYMDENNIYYTGGDFIVFKKIILLLKYNNIYYLIGKDKNKTFTFNDNDFIKSILINSEKIKLIFEENFNPVSSNWSKFIKNNMSTDNINNIEYTDKLNGYDIEDDDNKDNIKDEYINESMSLIELQRKAKELKIDIFYEIDGIRKIKNKKILCKQILEKK